MLDRLSNTYHRPAICNLITSLLTSISTNLSLFWKVNFWNSCVGSLNNFIYFSSKTNLIVIKLLHCNALKSQSEFNYQFVVVIEITVIDSLIYCYPKTSFITDNECCRSLFSRKKYPLTQKMLCWGDLSKK